ncbi:MAG TPA: MlaD family protein [Solirubrobacteraceae bacterium]|nr:MlaD family protein [Solirubrobacteraceae bacterium]
MATDSPPVSRIATMVLFALSCVGLLLFLWLSFGGTMPFNPQGYRVEIAFPSAYDLANQADVRIAGVSVGKVVETQRDAKDNRTLATIQIDNQYAPLRKNTQAILREKTILGETYVQLTPGTPHSPPLADGGRLPNTQVVPATQLNQIFDTFDPTTRAAFRSWQQSIAQAVTGNDQNLNDVLGNLPPFAINFTQLLQVLNIQHTAVVSLVQNGGTTFAALNQDPAALRNLITAGDTTFGELARNNVALADVFHIFPTFLTQSRLTMADLKTFSANADPVIRNLIPVAQKLKPTLTAVNQLAPSLRTLFVKLGPLVTASSTGLPATERIIKGLGPNTMLDQLGPFLEQLNPILDWIGGHQQLTSDFITDGGASFFARTTTFGGNGTGHYLRQFGPSGPETLSLAPNRDTDNRGNVYPSSLWLSQIFNAGGTFPGDWGLAAWDCRNTGGAHGSTDAAAGGHPACWTQPTLPGSSTQYKVPPINSATYSSK